MNVKTEESMIPKILGIVVAVIVACVVLIPIVGSVTETESTMKNTGLYFTNDVTESHTMVLANGVLTVDGTAVSGIPDSGQTPILIVDNLVLVHKNNLNWVIDIPNTGGFAVITQLDITLSNGELSGTYVASGSSATLSLSFETMELITNNISTNVYGDQCYALSDSTISMGGLYQFSSSASNHYLKYGCTGTIEDGITVTTDPEVADRFTFTNGKVNVVEVSGYEGLYIVQSISFDMDYVAPSDPSITAHTTVTLNNVIAPESVTVEKSVHMSNIEITIMQIIPVFVVLAILMGIVGMFIVRNKD